MLRVKHKIKKGNCPEYHSRQSKNHVACLPTEARAKAGRLLAPLSCSDFSGSLLRQHGFTMVEILIVIGVLVVLSTLLLVYGRVGESQIVLFKEQAQLLSVIYRAKALSIETFSDPSPPCGFGVHFDLPGSYIIWADVPIPPLDCKDPNKSYVEGVDKIHEHFKMDLRITFESLPPDILFTPPNPKVWFSPPTLDDVVINLAAPNAAILGVTINSAGQITLPN